MGKETKKIPVGAREKLPGWVYPTWATSGTAMAIGTVLIGYATFYCTDVLGLQAAVVGIIILITRFTDGFTDLVIGYLVDNTHTKWGQARPYEIAAALSWIFMMMFFSTPDFGKTGKIVWVFIMYFLVTAVCQTIVYGEDKIYMLNAFKGEEKRNKVLAFSGSIMMVATIMIGILLPQLVAAAGKDAAAWSRMVIMIGIPCALIGILRMLLIPEYNVVEKRKEKQEKIRIGAGVKALLRNKYIMIFVMIYFIQQCTVAISNSCGNYFFKYYIGDIGLMSITGMSMFIMPVLLVFAPKLIQKIGTRRLLFLGTMCGLLSPVIRILSGTNMAGQFIATLVGSVFQVPSSLLLNVYVYECMEYGEWRTGIRVDGMISSLNSVAAKVAAGLSSVTCGFVLGLAKYDGTLDVQSDSAMNAIVMLYNVLPLVLCVIALIFTYLYDLEKKLPQIREDMAHRHSA